MLHARDKSTLNKKSSGGDIEVAKTKIENLEKGNCRLINVSAEDFKKNHRYFTSI